MLDRMEYTLARIGGGSGLVYERMAYEVLEL